MSSSTLQSLSRTWMHMPRQRQKKLFTDLVIWLTSKEANAGPRKITSIIGSLSSVHPIPARLDVFNIRYLCPHDICYRFGDCHTCHCGRVNETFNWLLATCNCCSCDPKMRMCSHAHIGERQLQWTDALLLCNETRDWTIYFVWQGIVWIQQKEDEAHGRGQLLLLCLWDAKWLELAYHMVVYKGFLWHLSQDQLERKVDRLRPIVGVIYNHFAVPGDFSQDTNGAILSVGNSFEDILVRWANQKCVILLVFRSPDLKHR